MNLREKIVSRLDDLEAGLRSGRHLAGHEGHAEMTTLLISIAKLFSALDDGEREFVGAARLAIGDALPWT